MKKRILNEPVTYTEKFSENAKSICEALLAREVDKRLGFKNGTCDELRAHPFFSSINWRKLDAGMIGWKQLNFFFFFKGPLWQDPCLHISSSETCSVSEERHSALCLYYRKF